MRHILCVRDEGDMDKRNQYEAHILKYILKVTHHFRHIKKINKSRDAEVLHKWIN